jgi:CRISPR-associated endonuclease Cas3-HD
MEKSFAKSNGLSLENHSNIVSKISTIFANKTMSNDFFLRYENVIKYSSQLHDIGKLTKKFQEFLISKRKSPNLKFRHNEIGWAFLSKYLSNEFEYKDFILNIVYWHHGISNKVNSHTDTEILNSLDDTSIKNMLSYLTKCVGDKNINQDIEFIDSVNSPSFYPNTSGRDKEVLPVLILLRSVVITSDRIGSGFIDSNDVTESVIDEYFNLKNEVEITNTKFDNTPRFELQKNIVDLCDKTTLIKAPAGFGKTITGLMWSLKNKRKVLWVTPRNTVAKSVYHSIIEECNNLNINPSVQLVLTGEIVQSNRVDEKMYDSDIIVTNIDNFLAPSFKNDVMDSSCLLFGTTVIFDEYHELITDVALNALFINVMRGRHRLTTSKTLLLSATPIDCEFLWDSIDNKTKILPNTESHYPAIHDKEYILHVVDEKPTIQANTNSLVTKNTIKSAQSEKRIGEYELLLHNEFLSEKKDYDLIKLLNDYGKNSIVSDNKPNVLGTHMIQASLDFSCKNVYEDVLSPQSTMQRIGRCNRFGNYGGQSLIHIIKEKYNGENGNEIKGERMIKNILYTNNLSDSWFDFLLPYNEQSLTLNQLYIIFNDFSRQYSSQIRSYVKSKFDESNLHLNKIYPIKIKIKKSKEGPLTAGSNKLRCTNNTEIFITLPDQNGKWVGPLNKKILNDFDIEFRENPNTLNRMIKTMKNLKDDNRFEYNDFLDNKYSQTIDEVRRMAKKSNTPYIVYDRYYDDELGVVKIENFN